MGDNGLTVRLLESIFVVVEVGGELGGGECGLVAGGCFDSFHIIL